MTAVLRPIPEPPTAQQLAIMASDAIAAHWGGDVIAVANADPNEVQHVADLAIWRHGCDTGMVAP